MIKAHTELASFIRHHWYNGESWYCGCGIGNLTVTEWADHLAAELLGNGVTPVTPLPALPGRIYDEVSEERSRAHAKHGDKSMEGWPANSPMRYMILAEEVGEVAKEFNDAAARDGRQLDYPALRKELIQVAAMAAAWADRIGSA
jgi:NTP pyrophosphatase (non-canonical NTP hydrolase)